MKIKTKFKETEIGKIPEDWEILKFDSLISNIVDNRGKSAPTAQDGIALIATNCIKETGLFPVKEKIRFVSLETYNSWFREHPKPGDIIIVNKGTPGQVCFVPDKVDFCIAQDMVALRANEHKIYPKYLFAYLRSSYFKNQVDSLNVGTTIPHLKKTFFHYLKIPRPSKAEQQIIGDLYYNLSLQIELNQKMNNTLEAIGQALFKRWFVDFEFPNKEGKPYKSSGGEMIYSEEMRKEIPRVWKAGTIGHEFQLTMGQSPPGDTYNDTGEGIAFYQGRTDFGFRFPTRRIFCIAPTRFAISGDTLVSVRAPVGDINMAIERCCIGRGVASIRHNSTSRSYTYYSMLSLRAIFANFEAEGTVFGCINKDDFHKIPVVVPIDETVNNFEAMMNPIDSLIEQNEILLGKLGNIRDKLLPKLMSGQITINDISK